MAQYEACSDRTNAGAGPRGPPRLAVCRASSRFPEMPDLLYSLLSGVLFWLVSNLY